MTEAFKESEHLGIYQGQGTSMGAVCDPNMFDGVVIIGPGILGPRNGSVGFDLLAPGYEATWERDIAGRFYFGDVVQRKIFSQPASFAGDHHTKVMITLRATPCKLRK